MKPPSPPAAGPGSRTSARRWLEQIWYQDGGGAWLAPLGWLYGLGVMLRRGAYRSGLLASQRLPVPVLVVGNITAGGTGKTPVVAWLVDWLRAAGYRPGIVSRGYGGRVGAGPRLVEATDDPEEVGDEPLLLRRQAGVPVCTGANRVAAARKLLELAVDVVVADDGLQHYRLARDLELAVLDGDRRLGNGRFLPAGPLREPAKRLRQVDRVLVNGGPVAAGELQFHVRGDGAQLPDGTGYRPLRAFSDHPVRVLAGIGNPDRFCRLLAEQGLKISAVFPVDDHGRVPEQWLRSPGDPIFMTTKDAVKYRLPMDGSCWVVPVTAEMPAEFPEWLSQRLRRSVA